MLEEKDIQVLKSMMETVLDDRLSKSENVVLGEVERTRGILETKIEAVQKNLDDLKQYYKVTKLENDNTALLLQMIQELRKEVDELKTKIA